MLKVVLARGRLAGLDPTRGLLRLLRGVGVGSSVVIVSLAGHVAGGGVLPPMATLGIVSVLAMLCAWALSVVRWTVASLVGVMVAAQSVLHLVFSAEGASRFASDGVHAGWACSRVCGDGRRVVARRGAGVGGR